MSYTPKGATKPALGTVKVESDTSVAMDERLVSFSELKITEPNFPTLQRDQLRTVVEEIVSSVPLDERVIALDRVLANIDTSQIIPKNVDGVKADPPTDLFQQDARRAGQHRRRADLGDRSRRTICPRPSTQTGISSSTARRRPSTSATTESG